MQFYRFLVNVNLAILLNCLQEEDCCMQFADENWPLVLSPWLTCNEKETRFVAFIIASSLSHHFYDEKPSIYKQDRETVLTCLAKASELPNLRVPVLNNLIFISAVQFILSFKLLMANLNIAFETEAVFDELVNILVNGGIPEIKAACSYICALGKLESVNLKSLLQKCPLPVVEILEQFQEIEDAEIKILSENALLTITGTVSEGKVYNYTVYSLIIRRMRLYVHRKEIGARCT